MIHVIDHFSHQPRFACGGGHKRQIWTHQCAGRKLNDAARRKQPGRGQSNNARGNQLMESLANRFMAWTRRLPEEGFPCQNFLIGLIHEPARTLPKKWPVCERLFRAMARVCPAQQAAAPFTTFRSQIDDPIRLAMRSRLCSITMTEWPRIHQPLNHLHQPFHIGHVQSDRRLFENEEVAFLPRIKEGQLLL